MTRFFSACCLLALTLVSACAPEAGPWDVDAPKWEGTCPQLTRMLLPTSVFADIDLVFADDGLSLTIQTARGELVCVDDGDGGYACEPFVALETEFDDGSSVVTTFTYDVTFPGSDEALFAISLSTRCDGEGCPGTGEEDPTGLLRCDSIAAQEARFGG